MGGAVVDNGGAGKSLRIFAFRSGCHTLGKLGASSEEWGGDAQRDDQRMWNEASALPMHEGGRVL